MAIKEYYKQLDPNTGTITKHDCDTGELIPEGSEVPCPTTELVPSDVCLTPNENVAEGVYVDPALVIHGKCVIAVQIDVAAGTTTPIGSAVLFDSTGADVTETHTAVPCPNPQIVDGGCYDDGAEGEGK